MRGFLELLRQQGPLLGFGALFCFASSFGQTFFIAVFGGAIRSEFGLGHGAFGATYSAATLASAVTLIWLGRLVDRVPVARLTSATVLGLALACLLLSFAQGPLTLALAFYGLRLAGQGMAPHIAISTMAKRFSASRGRAISIVTLGFPLSEILMPHLAVAAIGLGWRWGWRGFAVLLVVLALPALLGLIARAERPRASTAVAPAISLVPSRRQGEVLRDPRFWLLLPGVLAPSIIVTGIFFHQVHIVGAKGWPLGLFAATFTIYALGSVASSLASGWAVDRFGASRSLLAFPLLLATGCLLLASSDAFAAGILMMIFLGLASGGQSTAVNALWAELYGTEHLGAIRSLAMAFSVFGSALSPIVFGAVFDRGVPVEGLAAAAACYVVLAGSLFVPALRREAQPAA
jgi:MFS family permease